ncbi:hypothetical protein LCGC14_1675200 [marine sediment metagenome]|uniref:DUF4145 domain-containing protein n=1 Tax=marine sediment metagenome TaxID=412755 RepID=A0A0F9HQW6_9ZZZZ
MATPREIIDAMESVLGIFLSNVRHKDRAAFILCDELVEMACKLRAREDDHHFDMTCGFKAAWKAPGVSIPPNPLGDSIQRSRHTRNTMQHASAAATVDERHCADAILDALAVIEHCWNGAQNHDMPAWMICVLRIVRLYSSEGTPDVRQQFEDRMRDEDWRGEERKQPRINEIKIRPGLRSNWGMLLTTRGHARLTQLLDEVGAD